MRRGVLTTLAFYDIFNYPLTAWEVFKFLQYTPEDEQSPVNLVGILAELKQLSVEGKVCERHGFYFLPQREEIIEKRLMRNTMAIPKWDRALKMFRLLRFIPFVKMAALCNTNAIDVVRPESDIDVFIVARNDRLWMTRVAVTTLFAFFGAWRRSSQKTAAVKNELCLSFFVSERAQGLESLQKTDYDPYLVNWVALVAPIYTDKNHFFAANKWIKKYLPNARAFKLAWRRRVRPGKNVCGRFLEFILGGKFGDWCEKFDHKLQFAYMRRHSKADNMVWDDEEGFSTKNTSDVVISKDILKFHNVDNRVEYKEKFLKRLQEVL